jgi:hypothetical protein
MKTTRASWRNSSSNNRLLCQRSRRRCSWMHRRKSFKRCFHVHCMALTSQRPTRPLLTEHAALRWAIIDAAGALSIHRRAGAGAAGGQEGQAPGEPECHTGMPIGNEVACACRPWSAQQSSWHHHAGTVKHCCGFLQAAAPTPAAAAPEAGRYPAGQHCRFRYTDGRWYYGTVHSSSAQSASVRFSHPIR